MKAIIKTHPLSTHPAIHGDKELISIFQELEDHSNLVFFVAHLSDRSVVYATLSFQTFLDYSVEELKAAGPDLLFSMVDNDTIPFVLATQRKYIEQAKAPGFDPSQPIVMEFSPLPMTSKGKR